MSDSDASWICCEITAVLNPQLEKCRCDKSKTTAKVVQGIYILPVDVVPENSPSDVINKITVRGHSLMRDLGKGLFTHSRPWEEVIHSWGDLGKGHSLMGDLGKGSFTNGRPWEGVIYSWETL